MMRWPGQALAYAVFGFVIACFSAWPEFRMLTDSEAIVSLSFTHAAERVQECRRLSQEELSSLPPNMRKPDDCPRERHDTRVELQIDGHLLFAETAEPSGLWNDGKASIYRRLTIAAGEHEIHVRMSDSGNETDFDFEMQRTLQIEPGQNLLISFDDLSQTFAIH